MTPVTLEDRHLRADARRNRERVLKAARECFAEHGADAQVDDIARKAKVGVGTVYRHFPTKQALFQALAADHFAALAQIGADALEISDPWEALTTYLTECCRLAAEDRALAELMAEDPESLKQAAMEREDLQQSLAELVRRAQEAGKLRADVVPMDLPMFICALGRVSSTPGPYTGWQRFVRIVLDGLRAKPSKPEPLPTVPAADWLAG